MKANQPPLRLSRSDASAAVLIKAKHLSLNSFKEDKQKHVIIYC